MIMTSNIKKNLPSLHEITRLKLLCNEMAVLKEKFHCTIEQTMRSKYKSKCIASQHTDRLAYSSALLWKQSYNLDNCLPPISTQGYPLIDSSG